MDLDARIDRLEDALARLAEAQARTEERLTRVEAAIEQLALAQARTERQVAELAAAQARTEEHLARVDARLAELAAAQARTEQALVQLTRQVGGRSDAVGGDIEDIAYIVLYDVLRREFGWEVGGLERAWQEWDGEAEEVNIFGQARDPANPDRIIGIVGEAKHNLTLGEVEKFARQAERARRHLAGEVYAVCFCYRARPEVRARLKALAIPLVISYGRLLLRAPCLRTNRARRAEAVKTFRRACSMRRPRSRPRNTASPIPGLALQEIDPVCG